MADRPAVPDLPDLPVVEALDALRAALIDGTNAVLVAPPGAGKTTVVPLALLDQPWLGDQRIVMLEPRRLATRAAARRMSTTTRTPIGALVGYQTRDEREITSTTRIEVVTEGVLTRRLQNDPELPGVGAVIFDEVHERNLTTDIGLALTLDSAAQLRPDLRIIAMSATPDTEGLARLLDGPGHQQRRSHLPDRRALATPLAGSKQRPAEEGPTTTQAAARPRPHRARRRGRRAPGAERR